MADLWSEFGEMFGDFAKPPGNGRAWEYLPNIDVRETDVGVEVAAELPGVDEKDVDVTLAADGRRLTIKGEKIREHEDTDGAYYGFERACGHFHRQIELPCHVEGEGVVAKLKDGVLVVTMAKCQPRATAKRIAVKAG